MFTGIIEEVGKVRSLSSRRLVVAAKKIFRGMELGGSVNINGVCLTVVDFNNNSFSVDIMLDTLKRTNVSHLHNGDNVNLEKPLTLDKPLGGHLVQGHIDDTGRIVSSIRRDETTILRIEAGPAVMRYVVEKGFIGIDF